MLKWADKIMYKMELTKFSLHRRKGSNSCLGRCSFVGCPYLEWGWELPSHDDLSVPSDPLSGMLSFNL